MSAPCEAVAQGMMGAGGDALAARPSAPTPTRKAAGRQHAHADDARPGKAAAATASTAEMRAGAPSLVRCVLTRCGAARGQFSDGSALWLEPGGRAFTAVSQRGELRRQLSACATREHAARVGAVLRFRNMHCGACADAPPYAESGALARAAGYCTPFSAPRARPPAVAWPATARAGAAVGRVSASAETGAISVRSLCGSAHLLLSAHGAHFCVTYPLALPPALADDAGRAPNARDAQEQQSECVWQSQVFAATDGCYPERWRPAVRLALDARASGCAPTSAAACADAATLAAAGAGGSSTALPAVPRAGEGAVVPGWSDLGGSSWWRSASLETYSSDPAHAPLVEWTPACTLHWVATPHGRSGHARGGDGEVRGTLAADGSLLETAAGGLLVRHVTGARDEDSTTLAAANVPEHVYALRRGGTSARTSVAGAGLATSEYSSEIAHGKDEGEGEGRSPASSNLHDSVAVPLGAAARRAVALRAAAVAADAAERAQLEAATEAAAAAAPGAGLGSGATKAAVVSTTLVTRVEVPRQGAFSAYADGRVRVSFRDRTLLELDGERNTADVIFPDGTRTTVRVAAPIGAEGYVRDALEFADWAFKTPEERSQATRAQQHIDATLAANQRQRAVCSLALSGRYDAEALAPTPSPLASEEAPRAAPPTVTPVRRWDAHAESTRAAGSTGDQPHASVQAAREHAAPPMDVGRPAPALAEAQRGSPQLSMPSAQWDAALPGGASTAAGRQLLVEEMLKRNEQQMQLLAAALEPITPTRD